MCVDFCDSKVLNKQSTCIEMHRVYLYKSCTTLLLELTTVLFSVVCLYALLPMLPCQVRRSGALTDVYTLWDLMGTEAVSGSVDDILHRHKPGFDRLSSIHAFDKVPLLYLLGIQCTVLTSLEHMF